VFRSDYMNAARRAYGLTHHAGNASRRSIQSFSQAMARSQPSGKRAPLFRVFDRDGFTLAQFYAQSAGDMSWKIYDEMPGCNCQTSRYLSYVYSFQEIQRLLGHMVAIKCRKITGNKTLIHDIHRPRSNL
jgi:hypothetical protein